MPEVFPAWEKLPRELNAADEVFGRRMRVLKTARERQTRPGWSSRRSRRLLQPVPKPEVLARMSRTVAVGETSCPSKS